MHHLQATSLCDELDDTTGLLDLALSLGGDVTGADDDGDVGETALAEDLGVAEGQEVEDGGRVGVTLAGEVLLALLGGNEGPELLEVDDGSPELVLELVEVTHTDLTAVKGVRHLRVRKTRRIGANLQVTGMVLVHVGSVVVLTTGETTTTGMLAVLTDTTVTGRDVSTVLAGVGKAGRHLDLLLPWGVADEERKKKGATNCQSRISSVVRANALALIVLGGSLFLA